MSIMLKIIMLLSSLIMILSCIQKESIHKKKDAVTIGREYLVSRGFDKATLDETEQEFLVFFSSKDLICSFDNSCKEDKSWYEKCLLNEICYQLVLKDNRVVFVPFLAQRAPHYSGGKSSAHVVVLVDTIYNHAVGMLRVRKKGVKYEPANELNDLTLPLLSYENYKEYKEKQGRNNDYRTRELIDSLTTFFSVSGNELVSKIDMISLFYDKMEYRRVLENFIRKYLLSDKKGILLHYELKDSILIWYWSNQDINKKNNYKVCINRFEAWLSTDEDGCNQ